jgi:Domain of unknown function (DUF4335)
MTIQRTYNLPNCTLLIEGISPGSNGTLSIMTNFECRFQHTQSVIAGGRKLLDALVESVGQYVQDLSGGNAVAIAVAPVHLDPINAYAHQLRIEPGEAIDDGDVPLAQPLAIRLNTIQLFDLMEGIDQLCLDQQTLPDLKLVTNTSELVIQSKAKERIVPAVMGIAGFAIAASAMFMIPAPKPQPQSQLQTETSTQTSTTTPQIDPKSSSLPPAIVDPDLVKELKGKLTKQIDRAWVTSPSFTEPVSYRVAVNAKGKIVGYKRTNPSLPAPEEDLEKELPLKKLTSVKTDPKTGGSPAKPQPTVTFRVTFQPKGTFTVTKNK